MVRHRHSPKIRVGFANRIFGQHHAASLIIEGDLLDIVQLVDCDERGVALRRLRPPVVHRQPFAHGPECGNSIQGGIGRNGFQLFQGFICIVVFSLAHKHHGLCDFGAVFRLRAQLSLAFAGLAFAKKKPGGQAQADHQGERHRATGGKHNVVPAHQFLQAVKPARRTRHHRLAVEITLDIHRQAVGRIVPAIAVLFQRLHDDPVQIALQL